MKTPGLPTEPKQPPATFELVILESDAQIQRTSAELLKMTKEVQLRESETQKHCTVSMKLYCPVVGRALGVECCEAISHK